MPGPLPIFAAFGAICLASLAGLRERQSDEKHSDLQTLATAQPPDRFHRTTLANDGRGTRAPTAPQEPKTLALHRINRSKTRAPGGSLAAHMSSRASVLPCTHIVIENRIAYNFVFARARQPWTRGLDAYIRGKAVPARGAREHHGTRTAWPVCGHITSCVSWSALPRDNRGVREASHTTRETPHSVHV